jgi:hypothetical protein
MRVLLPERYMTIRTVSKQVPTAYGSKKSSAISDPALPNEHPDTLQNRLLTLLPGTVSDKGDYPEMMP